MTDHGSRPWTDVDAAGETLLIPLGSTEQHGPHLPLDTDTRIAVAIARRAARRVPGAVVAPAVAYGASGEHQDFAGTLSIGTDALATVIVELARSALGEFGPVTFVNGHGGNRDALAAAIAQLTAEGRRVTAWAPTFDHPDPGAAPDAHAGHTETSLMLAIAADTVHLDRLEPGTTESLTTLQPRLRADGVRAHAPNGILGDPRAANADAGRRLLGVLVDSLVTHLLEPTRS